MNLDNAPSLRKFLATNAKKISEDDYIELRNKCIQEVYGEYIPRSVSDAFAYFNPKQEHFKQILEATGVKIKWKDEFELRLKDYLKEQGPNPGIGPMGKIDWYHEKRKELEELMSLEDSDVGC
jgi:hypothetical protein